MKTQIEFLGVDLTTWGSDRLFMYMLEHKISGDDDSVEYIENFLNNPESINYRKKYSKNSLTYGLDNTITERLSPVWDNLVKDVDYEEKVEPLYNKGDMVRVYFDFKRNHPNKPIDEFNEYLIGKCESVPIMRNYIYASGLCKLYKLLPKHQITDTMKSDLNKLLVFAIDRTEYYNR